MGSRGRNHISGKIISRFGRKEGTNKATCHQGALQLCVIYFFPEIIIQLSSLRPNLIYFVKKSCIIWNLTITCKLISFFIP